MLRQCSNLLRQCSSAVTYCAVYCVGYYAARAIIYGSTQRNHLLRHLQSSIMGWLRFVGSFKLHVSFAKEPYKRDDILQKKLIILRRLLIVATPYDTCHGTCNHVLQYIIASAAQCDCEHNDCAYDCVCCKLLAIRRQ